MNTTTQYVLGVDGGGTKTDWIHLEIRNGETKVLSQGKLPAANLRLISSNSLLQIFSVLPAEVTHAGLFLAGCVTEQDRRNLHEIGQQIWPDASITTGSDRDSSLATAFGDRDGITVISGTGSAVTGRLNGKIERAGGRGHLLGDRGGAYVICIEGLRLALRNYDLHHKVTAVAENILRALSLNSMEELISWVQAAEKNEVSALAPVLFESAEKGDTEMLAIIEAGARALAGYTNSVARWLQFDRPPVRLLGGVFLHQPLYVRLYQDAVLKLMPTESVEVTRTPGAFGAAWLATSQRPRQFEELSPAELSDQELEIAQTEALNPASANIHQMKSAELVKLFVDEENNVASALRGASEQLIQGVDLITETIRNQGRIFYVGAGTSGRLGMLDASEIPPTFGEPSERFQAIIAGGVRALVASVEGAEDDEGHGSLAVIQRGVQASDVVCGIAASGRTPFVLGALKQAKAIGAKTILLSCNPSRSKKISFDVEIDLATGPEIISGSTRLKAGTATKVALNILSSCSMILQGKVYAGWMIHVSPTNRKLKHRAIRLLSVIKKWPREEAERKLEENNWDLSKLLKP